MSNDGGGGAGYIWLVGGVNESPDDEEDMALYMDEPPLAYGSSIPPPSLSKERGSYESERDRYGCVTKWELEGRPPPTIERGWDAYGFAKACCGWC